ncbi:ribonuclease HI family protein, partial [Modestobacter lapidis]|nr:ribonuclease HI family protein [Modestobacter lapidis]
ALLISPNDVFTPLAAKLSFEATNNITEYEACILALEAALELGIEELEVYGDSALIICQIKGQWKTRDEKLIPYHAYLETLAREFRRIDFFYLSRVKNHYADALAMLASMVEVPEVGDVKPLVVECRNQPVYCCAIRNGEPEDDHPWYHDIWIYLKEGEYPEGASHNDRRTLRRLASHYIICGNRLYRRSYEGIHLLCVNEIEAEKIIQEVHEGVGGPHMNGFMLAKKIMRLGYYWSTMERDCQLHVKKCHNCQIFAQKKHQPSMPLT